ncbi:hypothetical protein GCM10027168_17940 [Streptomyces capparidis]
MTEFSTTARTALANKGISVRAAARALNYDVAYLSRALNGKQAPSPKLAEGLDQLVQAGGELVRLAAAVTSDDRDRIARSAAQPSRVDGGTVRALAALLAAQRRMEDATGPSAVLPATTVQLKTISAMVKDARGVHRRELVDVAGQWATFVGWLHVATGQHRLASVRFNDAADFAAESGNTSLTSSILAFKAYAAGKRGDPAAKEGLTAAARRVGDVHPALQVYNAFQHARAFAELGEPDEGKRILDEAAGMLDTVTRFGDLPPWGYWYTAPFFKLQIGITHARLGNIEVAADLITSGLNELPEDQRNAQWTGEFIAALDQPSPA